MQSFVVCLQGYCDAADFQSEGVCRAYKADGEACEDDEQCENDNCDSGMCAAAMCD